MVIVGIESTCDETGVAVVKNGRQIISNIVASSVEIHKKYGGVIPEIAAREQVRVIIPLISQTLKKITLPEIDAIAVSYGPGLAGSLLVGTETAKALAIVWEKPLIPVNHLIGHIYANWLLPMVSILFPAIALIVSGGHTDLILMTDHGKHQWLGGTLDDAAGEAFDKVARVLGLGYPGGPEIEKVASSWLLVTGKKGLSTRHQKPATSSHLPRPMIGSGDFNFSFSGLKTAVVNLVRQSKSDGPVKDEVRHRMQIAYEFQEAVCSVLVTKTLKAAKKFSAKSIVVGGGVAANEELRRQFTVHSSRIQIPVFFPKKELSVDNGAMIAACAYYNFNKVDPLKLSCDSSLYFN